MNLRTALEERLVVVKRTGRPRILLGVYKQLAISHKGNKSEGEFRRFSDSNPIEAVGLSYFVADRLEENGLLNHAKRLRQQYLFPGANRFSGYMAGRFGESLRVVKQPNMRVNMDGYEWWVFLDRDKIANYRIGEPNSHGIYRRWYQGRIPGIDNPAISDYSRRVRGAEKDLVDITFDGHPSPTSEFRRFGKDIVPFP